MESATAQSGERETARAAFLSDGVSVLRNALSPQAAQEISRAFSGPAGRPGERAFALTPALGGFIGPHGALGELAAFFAQRSVRPVRTLFFDKTPEANWAVPRHQDRTIAVKERLEALGFDVWSVKNGVAHVEPPVWLLENMLTLRLFLDDCGSDNGPLEIACNTHTLGRIAARDAAALARGAQRFIGAGMVGDVLAMRLFCLHKSERAAAPSRRRVLHVDYCGAELPPPLQWAHEHLTRNEYSVLH